MKIRAPFKIQTVYAPDGETPAAFCLTAWIHVSDRTAQRIMDRPRWWREHGRKGFCWEFPAFGYHMPRKPN